MKWKRDRETRDAHRRNENSQLSHFQLSSNFHRMGWQLEMAITFTDALPSFIAGFVRLHTRTKRVILIDFWQEGFESQKVYVCVMFRIV